MWEHCALGIVKWFIMYKMYYSYAIPIWYQRSLIGNEILLMIHALWFAEISNMPFYAFSCFMHISCFVLYCTIEISLNGVIAKEKMTWNHTLITARKLWVWIQYSEARKCRWKNELWKSRLCPSRWQKSYWICPYMFKQALRIDKKWFGRPFLRKIRSK